MLLAAFDGDADDIVDDIQDDGNAHEHEHADGRLQEHRKAAEAVDTVRDDADDALRGDGVGNGDALDDVVVADDAERGRLPRLIFRDLDNAQRHVHAVRRAEADDAALPQFLNFFGREKVDADEVARAEAVLRVALHAVDFHGKKCGAEDIGRYIGVDARLDDERQVEAKQRQEQHDEDDRHRDDDGVPHPVLLGNGLRGSRGRRSRALGRLKLGRSLRCFLNGRGGFGRFGVFGHAEMPILTGGLKIAAVLRVGFGYIVRPADGHIGLIRGSVKRRPFGCARLIRLFRRRFFGIRRLHLRALRRLFGKRPGGLQVLRPGGIVPHKSVVHFSSLKGRPYGRGPALSSVRFGALTPTHFAEMRRRENFREMKIL